MKAQRIVKVDTEGQQYRAKCMDCGWEKGFRTEEDGRQHVEYHKLNDLHEKVLWFMRVEGARGGVRWEPFEPTVTRGGLVLKKVRETLKRAQ